MSALDRLVEAELIFRQGIPPDANYLFKHALVRDAAYESLLKAKRQLLHERLVAALEKSGGAAPEILAIHAQAANMTAKAVVYWQQAGDAAMARPAYQEAIGDYTNAVALVATVSGAREQELELRTKLGLASISAKGHAHPDTRAIFETAQGMLRGVRRPDLDFVAWYGLWCGHHVASDIAAARDSAKQLFAAGNAVGENSHRMMGTRALAMTAMMGGDFGEALRRHEEAFALHNPDPDRTFTKVVGQEQAVSARSYHAINLWAVGRADEAWQRAAESVRLAREIGHANSLGYGYMHATLVALCARRPEFPSLAAELIRVSSEHRLQMWHEFGLQFDAIRRLGDGDISALPDLRSARAALAARHAHLFSSLLALEAAHRLITHRRIDDALPLIDEVRLTIQSTGERYAEAEYHHVRAMYLNATGHDPKPALAEALRIAAEQGAKAWERRALETVCK